MPFHFKKAEPPAKAVRRVCREHINKALGRLRKARHPASVHGVRKEIKKLRAIFRLVRGEIGKDDYRKTAKALRKAADRLAAPRDARVTLQAFEKLAGGAARFPKIQKSLQKHCRQETRRFRNNDSVVVAKRSLRKISRHVAGLKIKAGSWTAIEPDLRQSYRRGRRAGELARRQPMAENFHEWRKQVKYFGYHLRLLYSAWPATAHALSDNLEQLGELLGEEHDLFLLKQFIAGQCADEGREIAALNPLIERQQKKLRAAALKLGSQTYAEPPAAVCARRENHGNA